MLTKLCQAGTLSRPLWHYKLFNSFANDIVVYIKNHNNGLSVT